MKVAYIGYDLTCLKASAFFEKSGYEVIYFLQEKNQNFNYPAFPVIDISTEHMTLPGDPKQRTVRQSAAFKIVAGEYLELKRSLNPYRAMDFIQGFQQDPKVLDLNLLKDLQYDGKQKKIFIELEKKGVESFDFVFN